MLFNVLIGNYNRNVPSHVKDSIAPYFEETELANQDSIVKFLYTQRITKRNWHNDAYVKRSRDVATYEMDDFAIMQTIAMSDEEIEK